MAEKIAAAINSNRIMDFFKELQELHLKTPRLYNINFKSENAAYCTHADGNKNCYLMFGANFCEDCFYCAIILYSRDCCDCSYAWNSELCYECADIDHCYSCSYSQELKNCSDCLFCCDCIGCKNCFGCAGLRQKEYCIFNKYVGKEKYSEYINSFSLKNKKQANEAIKKFDEAKLKTPRWHLIENQTENCFGDHIFKSKNCYMCFEANGIEDCLYCDYTYNSKTNAETTFSEMNEMCYECFSIMNCYNVNFSNYIRNCSDCEYCELLFGCKNCFGCIGLQNKEFYILNKPYSKEKYFEIAAELKKEMRASGAYGKKYLSSTYKYEDTAVMY